MPRKLIVLLAIAAIALVAIIAGTLAWDASRDDLVAKGVRVGPVDVGGMTRTAAELSTVQSNVTARIRLLEEEPGAPLSSATAAGSR